MARRRYQRGSVRLLPSGVWILRWREDVVEADGSVRRVNRKTRLGTLADLPTKKLAQRAAESVVGRVNSRDYRPGRFAALREFSVEWRRDALAMLKPSTRRVHESYLDKHLLPALGAIRLDELDQQAVQGFVARLSQKLKPKTVANVVGVLGAMLRSARAWDYTVGPVRVSDLTLPSRELSEARPCFSPDEVRSILAEARGADLAAYALMAFTGCRSGEAFGMTWDDIRFEDRVVLVRRSNCRGQLQTTKSRGSNRGMPMPDPLAEILERYSKEWRPNLGGYLFAGEDGQPVNPEAVLRWRFKPLLKRLGIQRGGFHAFRHCQASLLVSTGANVKVTQTQLGHSDPRVTLSLYAHVIDEDHRKAVDRVATLLRPDVSTRRAKLLRIK